MAKPLAKAPTTRKQWARDLSKKWTDSREMVIAAWIGLGERLGEAKAALEHGEFENMIRDDLPFSPGTARKMMAIAECGFLSNRSNWNDLPPSWPTLYDISRLEVPVLEAAAKSGEIKPEMKPADVGRIRLAALAADAKTEAEAFETKQFLGLEDLRDLAFSGKKFKAILADPPWKFETWSPKGRDRSPDYPEMTVEEICALPIADLAAKDCVLFLWGLNWPIVEADVETAFGSFPKTVLPAAPVVMRAWGFDYVTKAFNWIKQNESGGGLHRSKGKWTWGNPEDCWLAKTGAPKCLTNKVDEVFTHKVMEPSRKPGDIHGLIEQLVRGPYLEIFARRKRDGWTVWGDEIPRPLPGDEIEKVTEPPPPPSPAPAADKANNDEDLLEIPPYMRREA